MSKSNLPTPLLARDSNGLSVWAANTANTAYNVNKIVLCSVNIGVAEGE